LVQNQWLSVECAFLLLSGSKFPNFWKNKIVFFLREQKLKKILNNLLYLDCLCVANALSKQDERYN
jgi:hypothetical protein